MDDGSIAVVLLPNPDDIARPHVRLLTGPHGMRPADPAEELKPIPAERSIRRALPPGEYPSEPAVAAA
jgi:hypothetical protein